MRVAHLTDDELQVYLDRWQPRNGKPKREALNLDDIETLQHIERCPRCQEELALYRQLYHDLAEPSETQLPRSFARKATWSLPPFAAMRTRTRLKAGLSTGLVAVLVLAWLATRVDWAIFVSRCLMWADTQLGALRFWTGLLWDQLPPLGVAFPNFSAWWLKLYAAVEQAFTLEAGMIHFIIIAIAVALLVGSSDRLLMRVPSRYRLR